MISRLDVIGPLPTQGRRWFAKWYFVLLKKKEQPPICLHAVANADEYEDGTWHGLSRVKVIRDVNGFGFSCALLASCGKQMCVLKGRGGGGHVPCILTSISPSLLCMFCKVYASNNIKKVCTCGLCVCLCSVSVNDNWTRLHANTNHR